MNSKLTSFYIAYHSWVKSGAWGNGLFSTSAGLCVNAYDYFALIGADSDEPLKEMHAAFVMAGLDEALPFNESMDHYEAEKERCECHLNPARVAWIERHVIPQSAPEREQVRCAHAEWSDATFGDVGPIGPLKHLSKEAIEAVAAPGDLSEWADMQFLLWDAQRRAGISDEQITQAMVEKLEVNKQRQWPESKDREPCYHIKTTKGRPEKIGGFDWVDWNELSRRGLLERINREILHPIGLAVFRDPNTGQSGGALISPDGVWEYGRAGLYFATPSVLAAAISAVRCYDEMSTELIAEEMFKNGGASC